MKVRALFACATAFAVLAALGCAKKPPDLSDIPEPKPPPGYSPPPDKAPAAPGSPQTAPQTPQPTDSGK
ncbi:MAG: hypothetical protein GX446_05845 [Chthonomonadales bacterium]|nr:hypothetical protein [Chthonomonadales bacterium]